MEPHERMILESEIREKIREKYKKEIENSRDILKEVKKDITDPKLLEKIEKALFVKCPTCRGTGQVMISCCSGEVIHDDLDFCPECKEHMGEEDCPDCEGSGKVPEDKTEFSETSTGLGTEGEYLWEQEKDRRRGL